MVGCPPIDEPSPASLLVKGDFTMLKYLLNRSAAELERHVGFEAGRLSFGFQIVALAPGEALQPDDFELGASTRWSGGRITAGGDGELEAGTLVAGNARELLSDRGQNVDALKAKVAAFFRKQKGNTPAKVLPRWTHESWMQYPDATVLDGVKRSGIPQFKLIKPRTFVTVSSSGWFDSN
ncbi:hypothetical protein [Ramlibacter sp. WS9]|uniref:hypothetical protein n=1 Tax=Ramlibacter sp. WS9 TaxID=1882741 RepID=UPI00114364D0|nr:hypothetical protein [Ramlibacter sp. WS9]ROZ78325.1 hypothetical protein EEB15_07765 [Ramlibacter sp. WS9]